MVDILRELEDLMVSLLFLTGIADDLRTVPLPDPEPEAPLELGTFPSWCCNCGRRGRAGDASREVGLDSSAVRSSSQLV